MDSDNGRGVRLFGVNLINGRHVCEDEAVTTDPQVPGSEPSIPIDVEDSIDAEDSDDEEVMSDDEEVIVLSRTAFEEVLRSGRAESRSAANNRGSGEASDSNQQRIPDDNMQLEGRPGPSMSEPVAPPPPPPRAPFDCPICMGPFVEEVTTKCGHVFCEDCIRNAIYVQSNCPTCRRKVTYRDLMRIYLPSGN